MYNFFAAIFFFCGIFLIFLFIKGNKSDIRIKTLIAVMIVITVGSFIGFGLTKPDTIGSNDSQKKSNSYSSSSKKVENKSSSSSSSSSSYSSSSSSKKSSSNSSSKSNSKTENENKISALNNWLKNQYPKQMNDEYAKSGQQYTGTKEFTMDTAIDKFKVESGEFIVVINNNRLKGEGLSQKEVANYALNSVLSEYTGDMPKADNLNIDGSLKDYVIKKPVQYSELD